MTNLISTVNITSRHAPSAATARASSTALEPCGAKAGGSVARVDAASNEAADGAARVGRGTERAVAGEAVRRRELRAPGRRGDAPRVASGGVADGQLLARREGRDGDVAEARLAKSSLLSCHARAAVEAINARRAVGRARVVRRSTRALALVGRRLLPGIVASRSPGGRHAPSVSRGPRGRRVPRRRRGRARRRRRPAVATGATPRRTAICASTLTMPPTPASTSTATVVRWSDCATLAWRGATS